MNQRILPRKIQGQHLSSKSLSLDLENSLCGQKFYISIILAFIILLVCLIASTILSLVGAELALELILERETRLTAALLLIILVDWLLTDLAQSRVVGISVFLVGLSIFFYWSKSFLPSFIEIILIIMIALIFWGSTVAILSLIRFLVASLDILFKRPIIVRVLVIFSTLLGGILGTLLTLEAETIEISLRLKIIIIVSGMGFGLALILVGFQVNHRQNIPWMHPHLFRSWALKIGSWRGTSFRDLDLSRVSLKGSKLGNSDLRAQILYRTCFQSATDLERARVDSRYLDLENPKIQKLLTHGCSQDQDFKRLNLRGAYLQNTDLRGFDFTGTNLIGADFKGADLRGSTLVRTQLAGADFQGVDLRKNILIDANLTEADFRKADLRDCILVRTQVARANFSGADLTGVCIEDWSVSSKTHFTNVRCDYIYRRYQDGQPSDRYPVDRDFEPGEFASLRQKPENQLELVFKGEFDYTALSLTFDKLQTDKPDLNLRLQGIEQREDLWVVKVTSDNPATIETQIKEIQDIVYQGYEVSTTRLENNPLIRKIISDVANIQKTQEETAEEVKQLAKSVGSNFYFLGGTITNVTGAGEIQYNEASDQIRNLVTGGGSEAQAASALLSKLTSSNVATTTDEQVELIQLVILEEAQRDSTFKQFLLQQGQQMINAMPNSAIATAIQAAIAQLS